MFGLKRLIRSRNVKLYHGSTKSVSLPRADYNSTGSDNEFGHGFYVTEHPDYALNRAEDKNDNTKEKRYVVNQYVFYDEAARRGGLRIHRFESPYEWINFMLDVVEFRNKYDYDILIGPLADDGATNHLQNFIAMKKPRTKENLDELIQTINDESHTDANQYVFKTKNALDYLEYEGYWAVSEDGEVYSEHTGIR